MSYYMTYVLVPAGTPEGTEREKAVIQELAESHSAWNKAILAGVASADPATDPQHLLFLAHSYSTLFAPGFQAFLASEKRTIEEKVSMLMEPYYTELRVAPYRRECDCLLCNAVEAAKDLPNWKVQGVSFVFTKEEFYREGTELAWKREILRLGSPDPECDECGGSGITVSTANPAPKWDSWEIGTGFVDGVLKDCVKGPSADLNSVAVRDLDLTRLPAPHHIVTPEGQWLSKNDFVWFGTAVIVDAGWEQTTKEVIGKYKDGTLVVVKLHL